MKDDDKEAFKDNMKEQANELGEAVIKNQELNNRE